VQDSTQTDATQADKDFASELIASGVTTQPAETVIAVLEAHRKGASINAAAKGIWDQLQDGTADRGGCRRTPPAAARGGRLTGHRHRERRRPESQPALGPMD
jgi:hypothetical protein